MFFFFHIYVFIQCHISYLIAEHERQKLADLGWKNGNYSWLIVISPGNRCVSYCHCLFSYLFFIVGNISHYDHLLWHSGLIGTNFTRVIFWRCSTRISYFILILQKKKQGCCIYYSCLFWLVEIKLQFSLKLSK